MMVCTIPQVTDVQTERQTDSHDPFYSNNRGWSKKKKKEKGKKKKEKERGSKSGQKFQNVQISGF